MPHRVRCFQSGNSLVITIPADVRRQLHLSPGLPIWIGTTGRDAAVLTQNLTTFNTCRRLLDPNNPS